MKKLISLALALVFVLSMATVAFADNDDQVSEPTVPEKIPTSKPTTYTTDVGKAYEVIGSEDTTLYPAETLKFTVEADSTNPASNVLTVDDLEVAGNASQMLTITVPAYSTVGTYHYTISETAGSTQGVTYTTGTIDVSVLVTYDYDDEDEDGYTLTAVVGITKDDDGNKNDTFTNTYEVGSLAVTKKVQGNLASVDKAFDVDVIFTAENDVLSSISYNDNGVDYFIDPADWDGGSVTVTIDLKHDETVTFVDIPYGVTYSVEEHDYTGGTLNSENGYKKAEYSYGDNDKVIDTGKDTVEILNVKETDVDTGITLDTLPFVLILAVCAGAVVLFVVKRRGSAEF